MLQLVRLLEDTDDHCVEVHRAILGGRWQPVDRIDGIVGRDLARPMGVGAPGGEGPETGDWSGGGPGSWRWPPCPRAARTAA